MTEIQSTWGWLLAIDLFCSGLGAGAFIVVAILALTTGERFKATVRFGAWASAIVIVTGVLSLLLDVGQPLRAVVLFRSFVHIHSWMMRGAWLLFSAILVNGLFALLWTDRVLEWAGSHLKPVAAGRKALRALLAILGIAVNIGVASYTGILLSVLPFRPLWYTSLLPALFIASALLAGATLVAAYANLGERAEKAPGLRLVLAALVMLLAIGEGVIIWLYLTEMRGGTVDAVRSLDFMAGGMLGILFWGLAVALGVAVPFLAFGSHLFRWRAAPVAAVAWVGLVAALAGAWTLRFVVLSAGLPAMIASPALQQALEGIKYIP